MDSIRDGLGSSNLIQASIALKAVAVNVSFSLYYYYYCYHYYYWLVSLLLFAEDSMT